MRTLFAFPRVSGLVIFSLVIAAIAVQADTIKKLYAVHVNGKRGFINSRGRIVIPAKFDDVLHFQDGIAPVKVGAKWGYINESGSFIIEPRFDDARNFLVGLGAVKVGDRWGFVNTKGEFKIPLRYDFARAFADSGNTPDEKLNTARVKLDGKWVLIISPHRACEYYVGELDLAARRFIPETHGILDAGDAYASNISRDDGGRTLLWLWGRTRTPRDRGWNGVMTMPRVLSIAADGALRQEVPAEFATLRGPLQTFADISLAQGVRVLEETAADVADVEAEFVASGSEAFGFELRPSPSQLPSTTVAIQRGMLTVGSARAYVGAGERYRVRLFLDKRCMEVYVNDGAAALYTALDGAPRSRVLAVFARGVQSEFGAAVGDRGAGVRLESLKVWRMSPASFSLDRFHL